MEREHIIYGIYTAFLLLLMASIVVVPLLAENSDMTGAYKAFSYTCHQKLSRSLCTFDDGEHRWVGDCLPQTGQYVQDKEDRNYIRVVLDGITGYKIPVCSRDIGLYGSMLLAALVYPIVREIKDKKVPPAIFLIAAIVPLGLDGSLQLISELGLLPFIYESTNQIRLITGFISGFAASFYAIPLLMHMFSKNQ